MQGDLLQSPEEESTEKPENHVEAKSICKDHVLEHQSLAGWEPQLQVDKAAAALEAKSDDMGSNEKPRVEKKGKKTIGIMKQKKHLVGGGGGEAATTKKPEAEKKPTEKKTYHRREEACGIELNLFIP